MQSVGLSVSTFEASLNTSSSGIWVITRTSCEIGIKRIKIRERELSTNRSLDFTIRVTEI